MRPLVFCALLFTAPAVAAPAPAKAGSTGDAADLAERMMDRHDFERSKDALRPVLDKFQEKVGVTVLVDYRALLASRGEDMNVIDDLGVIVQGVKNARGETVLRQIADQIGAVIYYTPDHVLLTSAESMAALVGFAPPAAPVMAQCVGLEEGADPIAAVRATSFVTASFRDLPLTDAVRALSTRANRTAVISADAAEKAKTAVTASLANVPFEVAVFTLAEAAGLRAIRNGNTVLVVTPARAKEFQATETRLSVGMSNTILSLEDLEKVVKLFAASKPTDPAADLEALMKEVNRLRTEKKGGK